MKGNRFRTLWSKKKTKPVEGGVRNNILSDIAHLYDLWGEDFYASPAGVEYNGKLLRVYGLRDIGGGLFSAVLAGQDAAVVLRGDTPVHPVSDSVTRNEKQFRDL